MTSNTRRKFGGRERRIRARLGGLVAALAAMAPWLPNREASAADVPIANASFELPALGDVGFGAYPLSAQGGYGWLVSDASGIYNPPAVDYAGATGGGTPSGGQGAQIAYTSGFGDYTISQRLAGVDAMLGNSDDTVLEAFTVYTLKVSVGQRAVGNQFGATWGGYDIQLFAGLGPTATIIARDTDAFTPAAGTLVERTLTVDSARLSEDLQGLPLTILLRKTIVGTTAATDYDNVRLDATFIPPSADFDGSNLVDGADLTKWKMGFGTIGTATQMQGDADRSGTVDGHDFLIWQRRLGSPGATPGATSIPEPSVAFLVAATLIAGLPVRPRRRRASGTICADASRRRRFAG